MKQHAPIQTERALLGGLLMLGGNALEPLLTETGLTGRHLYVDAHRDVLAAMVSLHDTGHTIDALTVQDELRRLGTPARDGLIDDLALAVMAAESVTTHARTVIRAATWRDREHRLHRLREAADTEDEQAWESATAEQDTGVEGDPTLTVQALVSDFERELTEDPKVLTSPWPAINDVLNGGTYPGEVTVVSGHSSHGKSTIGLGWLEHAASQGKRVAVITNEMAPRSYRNRLLLGLQPPGGDLTMRGLRNPRHMTAAQQALARELLEHYNQIEIVPGSYRPWQEICRIIRLKRWDMCLFDLFDRLPAERGKGRVELEDEAISGLCNAAIVAGTAVLCVKQLSKQSSTGQGVRPAPTGQDLRGSGRLYTDPSHLLFVHQEQKEDEDTGIVTRLGHGTVWMDKTRDGAQGGFTSVRLNPARMRFEVPGQSDRAPMERAT